MKPFSRFAEYSACPSEISAKILSVDCVQSVYKTPVFSTPDAQSRDRMREEILRGNVLDNRRY